jgi:flagellar biosynthesis GTPase FlhF
MNFKFFVAVALTFLVASAVRAQTNYHDTANCRWTDGRSMSEKDCEFFRKLKAADEAEEAAHQARSQARLNKQREERQAQEQARSARLAAEKKEREERFALEMEKAKVLQQQREQDEKVRETEQDRQIAILRTQCGSDLDRPAIGQTITRFQKCVGDVEQTGQINRKDGVVTTYEGSGYVVHVMGGKVVAWSR